MDFSHSRSEVCIGAALILALSFLSLSCSKASSLNQPAYVLPERLKLRSSTAQASRIVAELNSGDRVTITGRASAEDGTPWVKVNGPDAETGWAEARFFVKDEVVEESRRIADKVREIQTQAIGKSKATLKLRLTPDRSDDSNVATMLSSGTVLEIVGRERKPKPANLTIDSESDESTGKTSKNPVEVKYDDWYLVRLKDYSVLPAGWIYGGSVGLEIPSEIIYFGSSGRRITGWQKIATIHGNDGKSGDHYLVLERKVFGADEQVDFDRVKVLAYDPFSRNYTTQFPEDVSGRKVTDLSGRFPITLKMEGTRGQFQLTTVDKNNHTQLLTYDIEMLEGGKLKVKRSNKK